MREYSFGSEELQVAADEWGCNCGPTALAFALGKTLDEVRPHLGEFERRGYINVTGMRDALRSLGISWTEAKPTMQNLFDRMAIVRIQWTGPWAQPGAKPARWAATATHWIATYTERVDGGPADVVFDCNGGMNLFDVWESQIVPTIIATIKRADGGWFPTHIWRIA